MHSLTCRTLFNVQGISTIEGVHATAGRGRKLDGPGRLALSDLPTSFATKPPKCLEFELIYLEVPNSSHRGSQQCCQIAVLRAAMPLLLFKQVHDFIKQVEAA